MGGWRFKGRMASAPSAFACQILQDDKGTQGVPKDRSHFLVC